MDLCKYTRPYQIVLARVPCDKTLRETVARTEQRIAEFRNDPNHEHLQTMSSQDRLIIPDITYALTHHFEELVGEYFQNQAWQGHFIFDAREVIDFALTRTGLILKSEGRFGAAAGIRTSHEPRRLYFDRPFLIYVRKRGANARPFFVMWVDNAELMQPYDAPARTDSSRP